MAFTYDETQLSTSTLYQVRFTIGDTDVDDPLLQDEEIEYVITQKGTVLASSIACCESISAKFARKVDYTLGPYSIKASQKAKLYKQLASDLRSSGVSNTGFPIYTGPPEGTVIFDIDMMNYAPGNHISSDTED
jgi:hypothetical protein